MRYRAHPRARLEAGIFLDVSRTYRRSGRLFIILCIEEGLSSDCTKPALTSHPSAMRTDRNDPCLVVPVHADSCGTMPGEWHRNSASCIGSPFDWSELRKPYRVESSYEKGPDFQTGTGNPERVHSKASVSGTPGIRRGSLLTLKGQRGVVQPPLDENPALIL